MDVCLRCDRMMYYWKKTDEIERQYGFLCLNYMDEMEGLEKELCDEYGPVKQRLVSAINELCTCNGTVCVERKEDEIPF